MSTFNDDLSADMSDPEFAAEFERTTGEVRRERYAAAIAAADDMRKDWCYAAADAAMALANEEIGGLAQELVEMGGDLSARRREGERLAKLNRDLVRDCRAAHEDSARLRAELEKTHAQGSGAIHPFADEGSASLFMEAAALRGQAASLKAENKRLRAELEESRRISDEWATAHGARSAETSIARDDNARLRAELAEQKRLHEAFKKGTDAGGKEMRKRLTDADSENNRLRAELEESRRKECDALCSDVERDRDEYEVTISRVRAVLDEWYGTSDASALSAEIRTALSGESS